MEKIEFETRNLKLSELRTNTGQIEGLPANPRTMDAESLEKLKKSLTDNPEMMSLREILAIPHDGKFIIIGGNMRYRAAKELGIKELPCKIIPESTPVETLKAYVIKDNASFGKWDFDLLANEWDADKLLEWDVPIPEVQGNETEKEAKEDDFDENEEPIVCKCKKGEIWKCGNHRVMCGDSTQSSDVEKLMGGAKADLWLTDPPYNVGISNSKDMKIANDSMSSKDFKTFLHNAFASVVPYMEDGCPFYIWFSSREHINFEQSLNDSKLTVRQELVWNKSHFTLGRQHYQWKHEPCLYGWKGDTCKYFVDVRNLTSVIEDEKEINIDAMKKEEMKGLLHKIYESKIPTTVIDEKKPGADADHPTMKPVRLFGRLISNSSRPGNLVLDTFGGSGTTMIAAEQLGRKAYLMELDPHYCDVIIARWEKFTGNKAEKIS